MGRKRKRKSGSAPPCLSPSLHPAARPKAPSISRATPQASTKRSGASASSSTTAVSCTGSAAEPGGDSHRGATPTVPTAPKVSASSPVPHGTASDPVGTSAPPPHAPSQSSGSAPKHKRDHTTNSSKTAAAAAAAAAEKAKGTPHQPNQAPTRREPLAQDRGGKGSRCCVAGGGMGASEVLVKILPVSGWRLGHCWGRDCPCAAFIPRPAMAGKGAAVCSCGHRSVAHELVDAREEGVPGGHWRYRSYGGNYGAEKAGASAEDLGAGMRRLFSAVRNARAVGDCGLFEDSEGLRGWGAGWFLSRLARGYLQQARQAVAELGGALHDAPTVARCLATTEALLSGNATREWTMPNSLPSASIYQALGTGIASELDLAYFHVRYSAVSRFDAGGVAADAADLVVPPPEVYFACLAFHMPSLADLRALPALRNPGLRRMLGRVFDLPVEVEEATALGGSSGTGSKSDDGEIHLPVLTNPLLAVTQSAWLETAISADAKTWVSHFPPRFGQAEGTMRGSDPALPPPIRARCDATRDWSARLLAFAVPNRRAVAACRRAVAACRGQGSGIVEVGAGLGYWKWVLEGGATPEGRASSHRRHLGGKLPTAELSKAAESAPLRVLAIDKDPSRLPRPYSAAAAGSTAPADRSRAVGGTGRDRKGRGRNRGGRGRAGGGDRPAGVAERSNEYHGGAPAWAAVEEGGPGRLRSLSAADYPVLLLCYPPPSIGNTGGGGGGVCGPGAAACMGVDALAGFLGKVVLYVGEIGGDTGSPRLEAALRDHWDMVEEVELPSFSSTANRLMVFARKGAAFLRPSLPALVGNDRCARVGGAVGAECPPAESAEACWGPALAMYRCAACGTAGARLHRCRLTRAVSYCSEQCLYADGETWRAHLDARHIHIAAGAAGSMAGGGIGLGCSINSIVFRDKKMFKRLAVPGSGSAK